MAAAISTGARARAAEPAGTVKVWATYRDKRYAKGDSLTWKAGTEVMADAIVLDTKATRQEILGFGAAMTDSSCYVLGQLPAAEREAILHEMFAPDQMAFNVCRTCIGSSDYSKTLYSFDESDTPDPELKKFSIDHDKAYILPALRDARRLNPELFLFSSPWSPPGWMKSNGSMLGGAMRKHSFEPYANYFRKFLEAYKADGVTIDAVTVQNEVDTDQDSRMPACLWGQEYEVEFVRGYLGPVLKKAGLGTKIWVIDHNYNLWGRAIGELSDPEANQFIDGIAWHGYVGEATAMTQVHDAFPEKSAYWTEGGPDISAPDYATDWTNWAGTFAGVLNNWARSITSWNLVLDEKGNPNIGPFPCGGVVTVDSGTRKVTQSGQYWAFAHFTKHVKRGAKVFATNGLGDTAGKLSHVGFRNPDGGSVVVLANHGPQTRVQLVMGAQMLTVELPADSVETLQWS
jgi:glucosylceramidase